MSFLEVSHIGKKQETGTFELKDISFHQEQFQKLAIIGATGSGKSTLMKIIGGLVQGDTGNVIFEGKRVKGPEEQLIPGPPGMAYLSQHYELRNHHRVEELLSYANTLTDEAAMALYQVCRIDHLLKRRTNNLSGGEKQRIALARILIGAPRLLLMDEPFSNLDPIHTHILKSVVEDLGGQLGITCMLISHDPVDVLPWADKIVVIRDGALVQEGTAKELYLQPGDEHIGGLLGNYNIIEPAEFGLFKLQRTDGAPGQRLFVRPEHVKIFGKTDAAVRGIVSRVFYFGGYIEIEVTIGVKKIIARPEYGKPEKGAEIYIAIDEQNCCFVEALN